MILLFALAWLFSLAIMARWVHQWGIAEGRLLERRDRIERRAAQHHRPQLTIVADEDDVA